MWFDSFVEEDTEEKGCRKQSDPEGPGGVADLIRQASHRRNLLFLTTLVTLFLVFIGAVPLGETLMVHPLGFFGYWALCFLLVVLVLVLAFYDLMRMRRDHRKRLRELDKELAKAAIEARDLVRRNLIERGETGETGDERGDDSP